MQFLRFVGNGVITVSIQPSICQPKADQFTSALRIHENKIKYNENPFGKTAKYSEIIHGLKLTSTVPVISASEKPVLTGYDSRLGCNVPLRPTSSGI